MPFNFDTTYDNVTYVPPTNIAARIAAATAVIRPNIVLQIPQTPRTAPAPPRTAPGPSTLPRPPAAWARPPQTIQTPVVAPRPPINGTRQPRQTPRRAPPTRRPTTFTVRPSRTPTITSSTLNLGRIYNRNGLPLPRITSPYTYVDTAGVARRVPSTPRGWAVLNKNLQRAKSLLDGNKHTWTVTIPMDEFDKILDKNGWPINLAHHACLRTLLKFGKEMGRHWKPSGPTPSLTAGDTYDITVRVQFSNHVSWVPAMIRTARGVKITEPKDLDGKPDLRMTNAEYNFDPLNEENAPDGNDLNGGDLSIVQNFDEFVEVGDSFTKNMSVWLSSSTEVTITFEKITPIVIGSAARIARALPPINDSGPKEMNCIVAAIYRATLDQLERIDRALGELPDQGKGGRPTAAESTPEAKEAKAAARRGKKNLKSERNNNQKIIERLTEFDATIPPEGIPHGDTKTLQELCRISYRDAIEIYTPFSRDIPIYRAGNPAPIGKINGVIRSAVKVVLVTAGHVEVIGKGKVRDTRVLTRWACLVSRADANHEKFDVSVQDAPLPFNFGHSEKYNKALEMKATDKLEAEDLKKIKWHFASASMPIKLTMTEMEEKQAMLHAKKVRFYSYPNMCDDVPNKLEVISTGERFVLTTPFKVWAVKEWYPRVKQATVFSEHLGEAAFNILCSGVHLTGRAKFPLYDTLFDGTDSRVVRTASKKEIESDVDVVEAQVTDEPIPHNAHFRMPGLRNIDQSKAYTRALVGMGKLLSKENHSVGKIAETFAITSQEQQDELLWAHLEPGAFVEGFLLVKQSWNFRGVHTAGAIDHIDAVAPGRDTSAVTKEGIVEAIKTIYSIADRGFEPPQVLTFVEARLLHMCGVKFEATVALVSYDGSVDITWDESSHEKDNGIAHYAKVIGACMRTNTESIMEITNITREEALDFSELAAQMEGDHRLVPGRLVMHMCGDSKVRIEQPLSGIATLAHISAYVTAGQRAQAVLQTFLIPSCDRIEMVTDGIYCVVADPRDSLLMPFFSYKDGERATIPYTPHVKPLSMTSKATSEIDITGFKPRNDALMGPFSKGNVPRLITGCAGSGKTTTLALAGLIDVVACSPTHVLRAELLEKFPQTICHARLKEGGRLVVEGTGRRLDSNPTAIMFVDESTMFSQGNRAHLEGFCKKKGIWLWFLGDFDKTTHTPMQCAPVESVTMSTTGLTSYHVEGVRRTTDPLLIALCEQLRAIRVMTFGGVYIGGDDDGEPPPNAVDFAIKTIKCFMQEHRPAQCMDVATAMRECKPHLGDVALVCTRKCPHCCQLLVENCFCPSAKTIDDINFINDDAKDAYLERNEERGFERDSAASANHHTSIAFDWARGVQANSPGCDVLWRALGQIKGTELVNGSAFLSSPTAPTYNGVDLTAMIGKKITKSPGNTIHSYQGITFEKEKLFIDPSHMWEVEMVYVAASRLRTIDQLYFVVPPEKAKSKRRRGGESDPHLRGKWLTARAVLASGEGIPREEYPIGDGRFVADMVVLDPETKMIKRAIEIVATNPPTAAKLAYYAELGIECTLVDASRPFATGLAAQMHHEMVDNTDLPTDLEPSMKKYLHSFKPGVTYARKIGSDGLEYGRAYPESHGAFLNGKWRAATLTGCPKEHRETLAKKLYTDFDMTAAAPTILAHLAEKHGVHTPFINCVKREPKNVRQLLADSMGTTYELAKKRINGILHCDETRGNDHDFLVKLREDTVKLVEVLGDLPEYAWIKESCVGHDNPGGSLVAKIWMTVEHDLLMAAWSSIKRDPRCVLIFDGMLVPNQHIALAGGEEALLARFKKATAAIVPDMVWAVKAW